MSDETDEIEVRNIRYADIQNNYNDHKIVLFIGTTGSGKSSLINFLAGQKILETGSHATFSSEKTTAISLEIENKKYLFIDTPGYGDSCRDEIFYENQLKLAMEYAYPGPILILIVLSAVRFKQDDRNCVEFVSRFFGSKICNSSLIVFTRYDDLEYHKYNFDDFIKTDKKSNYKRLIENSNNNYLYMSNKWKKDEIKAIEFKRNFLNKINEIINTNNNLTDKYLNFFTPANNFKGINRIVA